jgi:hypothetical protein
MKHIILVVVNEFLLNHCNKECGTFDEYSTIKTFYVTSNFTLLMALIEASRKGKGGQPVHGWENTTLIEEEAALAKNVFT